MIFLSKLMVLQETEKKFVSNKSTKLSKFTNGSINVKVLTLAIAVLLCFCPIVQAFDDLSSRKIVDGGPYMNGEIIVNGKLLLDAPTPYINGYEGVVMVPLRAIAEKLDLSVEWVAAERQINVGGILSIWIGKDYYVTTEGEHFNFGPPPELINNRTYVPISFFKYALTGYDAYIVEGKIVIENIVVK